MTSGPQHGPTDGAGHALRPIDPPVFLPDGTPFLTWERLATYTKTYHVDQQHESADDANAGTADRPFRTIDRAAQVVGPGERVLVRAGHYRECVRPRRGGSGPDSMVTFEAQPDESVVISGSEVLDVAWSAYEPTPSVWQDRPSPGSARLWKVRLPAERFAGYNPFAIANYRQAPQISYWDLSKLFGDPTSPLLLQTAGMLFQDGRRLLQLDAYPQFLDAPAGTFWVEPNGQALHVRPYGPAHPSTATWEATAREQVFAPLAYHLGYIAVRNFVIEHAGNAFPFPQRGALSTMKGHHWLIEGNTIRWANAVGVDIGNQGGDTPPLGYPGPKGHHIVRGNTFVDIGIAGLAGPEPDSSLIEDNLFQRNAWHDIESMAECAAIKTHHNRNVVIRRNLILDTSHGTGIYLDYLNVNSRVTQNVVINTGTRHWIGGHGGIYVEHALEPVLVDHNIVWSSTKASGIYAWQTTKLTIAHNLIGGCHGMGIFIVDAVGRNAISGGNTVVNNILVDNGGHVGFFSRANASNHNLFGASTHDRPFRVGITRDEYSGNFKPPRAGRPIARRFGLAEWRIAGYDRMSASHTIHATLDPEALRLTWSIPDPPSIPCAPIAHMDRDALDQPMDGIAVPGPFNGVPSVPTTVALDPRRPISRP